MKKPNSQMLSKSSLFVLTAGLATVTLMACQGQQATPSPTSEKKPASATSAPVANNLTAMDDMQGKALFVANCIQCHNGGSSPPRPNAVITDSERLNSEDSFRQLLRQPTSAMMKSFTPAEISDAQVHKLYQFVTSARQPK